MERQRALFTRFPQLAGKIPWLALGVFPTPVERAEKIGIWMGVKDFYIKRDDLSHPEYGGNKVRKLEFLLADAQRLGRRAVLTIGAWGSNHILATTIFAKKLGLKPLCVMIPQPAQHYARKNLLLNYALGCELNFARNELALAGKLAQVYLKHWQRGERAYFIWAGGSTPLGVLGYVNAGLELAEQIKEKMLPEPDYIFCAVGSCGTFAGLVLGSKLAGLKSKVVGVRVYERIGANSYFSFWLARSLLRLLKKADPDFPSLKISPRDFVILHNYAGKGYAYFTREGIEAVKVMESQEGIRLEGTYTGKTLAGIIDLARKGELGGKSVLFVNTYNSRPLDKLVEKLPDWQELPGEFHHCFTSQIQEEEVR